MNAADIRASIQVFAKTAIEEGICAMYTDEAIEATIVDELAAKHDKMHESTKMILMGMLLTLEMRRMEGPTSTTH